MKEQLSRFLGMSEKVDDEVKQLPLTKIIPNRYQPRTVFNDDKIDELCQTIKTHGVIQPIVVRQHEKDQYELIAGERRWRASLKLGLKTIPALVRNLNDAQSASVALIENLQREGLTVIEEAKAYQQLMEQHHLTQESLAQRLGKGQSTIANKLRLLNLPAPCQDALNNRSITERHARALLSLKSEEQQLDVLKHVLQYKLNVKETEEYIMQLLDEKRTQPAKRQQIRKSYSKDIRIALNTIRESVRMISSSGITIDTSETEHDDHLEVKILIPKS